MLSLVYILTEHPGQMANVLLVRVVLEVMAV
jgi:hypothetical protein